MSKKIQKGCAGANLLTERPNESMNCVLLADKVNLARNELALNIERSQLAILQFSGGKDSLACLELTRPWWNKILVVWASAGDELPETFELMNKVKKTVPNFVMVRGNSDLDQMSIGWPVDMLPHNSTPVGMMMAPDSQSPKLVLRYECCARNIWQPMERVIKQFGATHVINGQRNDEKNRNTVAINGASIDGICFIRPLQHWKEKDVFNFLKASNIEIPHQYTYGFPSGDCAHCTAFLEENLGKLRYLQDFHPAKAIELKRRLNVIQQVQSKEVNHLAEILNSASN